MRSQILALLALGVCCQVVRASVFINEVFMNPPGSLDDTREFIELCGTPGKNLDGYAIAFVNGTEEKYYDLNSIPPFPVPSPEIDEFFSLDGLLLGPNGLLVLAISNRGNYPEVLSDSGFQGNWESLWNGGLDTPGKLQNDGSNTILLIRHRPGKTQAHPNDPGGLRWGKTVLPDLNLETPVEDPQDQIMKDQWGDGELDDGTDNGFGGFTMDMVGATTPLDASDDLEVVDEVSYEHGRGWEYDTDRRKVDRNSPVNGQPERHVHALDDPQGFNPDALARVDSRLTGTGWAPAPGAIGEMSSGNNWQDTATEQWIRGESTVLIGPMGPEMYFSNAPNANTDAIQPYTTNVPLWLDDGLGADYDFTSPTTYRMSPGRMNPLSIPYIPGDVDRDGDCDASDIDRLLSVFGDDDWIFSNGFDEAIETNEGDPATQTRPWDVDQSGDNGIECSDLQWTLNFQGNTDGRIRGLTYDDTTPSVTGVALNDSFGVYCEVTVSASSPQGRPVNQLAVNDFVDVTVQVEVTSGANFLEGEQNGVMQIIHDVVLGFGGVVHVVDVEPLGQFSLGRPELMQPQGTNGDLGLYSIHAYTTSFEQGLTQADAAYRVRMQAVGLGQTSFEIYPAIETKFYEGTPYGIKVGHTTDNGNPENAFYPAPLSIAVTEQAPVLGDCDGNGVLGLEDSDCFADCMGGVLDEVAPGCEGADTNANGFVDLMDWAQIQIQYGQ